MVNARCTTRKSRARSRASPLMAQTIPLAAPTPKPTRLAARRCWVRAPLLRSDFVDLYHDEGDLAVGRPGKAIAGDVVDEFAAVEVGDRENGGHFQHGGVHIVASEVVVPDPSLRPTMNASAAAIWSTSSRFSSGMSNIQTYGVASKLSPGSSSNGRSSVWLRLAEYPSAEIVLMRVIPIWLVIAFPPRRVFVDL